MSAGFPQVTVLDFKKGNKALGDDDWTVGLGDFMELALQKQGVSTLERRQIRLVLGERELQAGAMVSAVGFQKRGLPPVDYFVGGNVTRLAGDEFELTVTLIRADNATMESAFAQGGVYPTDWLSAIDAIARRISGRLEGTPQAVPGSRSEFESLTWLPEAALPFFKGLEYFAREDYPLAAGWFRTASVKDPRFEQARLWEARALRQFGFPDLAEFAFAALGTGARGVRTNVVGLPVVAVIAPESVSVAGRSAFVNALARSGRFEMFEPQAIGATAREIDLQLTGQMSAPLNERSVWLVVDSMVFVEIDNGSLRARQSDLLSGQPVRQVTVPSTGREADDFLRLANAFLDATTREESEAVSTAEIAVEVEPGAGDRSEVVYGKVLRLAKAHPDQARPWIRLADFYREWTPRLTLLDRAIATIEVNPDQPDASFWLTSALWRKRYMLRRAYFYPGAPAYQENPLTNDFALLLRLFPDSTEARTLDESTHKAGIYTYSHPVGKATRYLIGPVYEGGGSPVRSHLGESRPPASLSESEWLARLKTHRRLGENAKAWMQANWRVPPLSPGGRAEVDRINAELLQIAKREDQAFKAFTEALDRGDKERALQLGTPLLRCLFRTQRLAVIERCAPLVKAARGCEAQVMFLIAEMERYQADFNLDPATGQPRTETVDFRFDDYWKESPGSWANTSPDLTYARVLGGVVESGRACGDLELTAKVFEALRDNEALPASHRQTATLDLARTRYDQGRAFEAMEMLQSLLDQTEGTGTSQARGETWSSLTVEPAAFELLKKIRLFADPELNFADCCGQLPNPPPARPDNLDEMNRWFDELWSRVRGGVSGNNRPIKEQLIERRDEMLPAMLYNLHRHERAQQMVMFAGLLGTNA
ncbi:MAG: hypothetical protein MUF81_20750, partial [Verrucomicrobia bacterium]|nr:hypothetical protein [Verrucomicrobiota bacterium]